MRRGKIRFAILCAAVLTAGGGCSKRNPVSPAGLQPPVFGASDSVFTDAQLVGAAYTTYAGPTGFYSEPPTTYASPLYVNTMSVAPPDSNPGRWVE